MNDPVEAYNKLTDTQKKIVNFMLLGYADNEIAKILFVSCDTIKTHSSKTYKKFQVSNRTTLVAVVLLFNLVNVDEVRKVYTRRIGNEEYK